MFPNARLRKAVLNRLTDQAYIAETERMSYRIRRTFAKKAGKA
jgi:hypothetical protein